jgi:hypothetical protein
MKQGDAVFLKTSPDCRGNVSKIDGDRFQVTWHAYVLDRPEVLSEKMGVNIRDASTRARSWYSMGDTSNIGFGTPS